MIISQDDAEQLASRARERHDEAAAQQSAHIFGLCADAVARKQADAAESHRDCRRRACRRARRCMGERPVCPALTAQYHRASEVEDAMAEELYFRVLEALMDELKRTVKRGSPA